MQKKTEMKQIPMHVKGECSCQRVDFKNSEEIQKKVREGGREEELLD